MNGEQRLRSDTVTVEGVKVRYFMAGEDRDHEQPIMLAHGIGGSTSSDFSFLMPMLVRRRLVVSVDFVEPAHGGAHADDRLGLDHLESQLEAVAGHLGPGREFTLLGYSLGAVVSAAFAAKSDLVSHLILVAGWMKPSAKLRLHSRIWRRLREERSASVGDYMLSCMHSASYLSARSSEELASRAAGMAAATSFDERQMELAGNLDITELLPRIGATTLVVGCIEDEIATEQQSKALFGAIDDARYVPVSSGHALLEERPAELLALVDSFIAAPRRHEAGTILPIVRP